MFFKLSKGLNAPPELASVQSPPFAGHSPANRPDFFPYFHMEDGPMFDPCKIPGSRNLHERRMATWALLIGETYSSAAHAETRRRPHRGMLPDVDFSRAVPDRSRPSLVRRIIRLIRPGAETVAKLRVVDTALSGSSNEPVGEKPATSYIARSRTGGPGDSGTPVFDATRSSQDATRSRARERKQAHEYQDNVPLV
ncbi:hypothetical protein IHQ72_11770 [Mesorhizobium onobrychidis]|uniref:Uncharacterized protein n=2 Tax=Mesorhizobium onobrychidis TaxID=2775404 RepID=A0ABY5R2I9_9HYPH|nr:hypothetical protein IHQ72_11770 [Mesorhizobium onobrychidis]